MKLLKLAIKGQYKSLRDQVFDFSAASGHLIALIGLNGAGKSQLLELLSEVFSFIERVVRGDFRSREALPFDIHLEYELAGDGVDEGGRLYRIDIGQKGVKSECNAENVGWSSCSLLDAFRGVRIVGYSSGQNENVQLAFLKNCVQFYDVMKVRAGRRKLLANAQDEDVVESINRRFVRRYPGIFSQGDIQNFVSITERDTAIPSCSFLDYDCSALILAALGMLPENELIELFPDVSNVCPQTVVFRYDLRSAPFEEDSVRDIQQLLRLAGDAGVTGLCSRSDDATFDDTGLNYLSTDIEINFGDNEVKRRFRELYFDGPVSFFEKMYKLQLLGVAGWQGADKKNLRRDAFFGNVKKPLKTKLPFSVVKMSLAGEGGPIEFDDLSDGESQLVQVIGAIRLYRDRNCLFILDEPETHLNPSWRTNFHSRLLHALGSNSQSQALISTRSPFLISSISKENVYKFERKPDPGLIMSQCQSQTYGASFEVLIKQHFGLLSMISATAVDDVKAHLSNEGLTGNQRLEWVESSLGDSMEKAYLLRRLRTDVASD